MSYYRIKVVKNGYFSTKPNFFKPFTHWPPGRKFPIIMTIDYCKFFFSTQKKKKKLEFVYEFRLPISHLIKTINWWFSVKTTKCDCLDSKTKRLSTTPLFTPEQIQSKQPLCNRKQFFRFKISTFMPWHVVSKTMRWHSSPHC